MPRNSCGEVPKGAFPFLVEIQEAINAALTARIPASLWRENLRYDTYVSGTNLCDGTICTCRPFRHQFSHGERDRAPNPPQVAQASFLIAVPISINATFDFKKGSKWDNTRPLYNSVAVAWTLH